MPLTPEDVRTKEFRNSFRGYNEPEVDAFLDEVEAELTRLLRENSELRERATTAASAASAAPTVFTPAQAPMGETEEMLRRTLLIAQRTADETVAQARAEADRLLAETQAHTHQLVSQAQQQANAHVGDLENRRRALEQHIEGLRAFEREYRTRLKAYLETQLRDLDGRADAAAPLGTPPAAVAPSMPSLTPSTPVVTAAPTVPAVEAAPSASAGRPGTDIPGGFVRRSENSGGDVPRVE